MPCRYRAGLRGVRLLPVSVVRPGITLARDAVLVTAVLSAPVLLVAAAVLS